MSRLTAVDLGKTLDLFFQDDLSPGSIFWKPKGAELYNNLIRLIRMLYNKYGYQEVITPNIADKALWQISGHWDKYRENMFVLRQDRYVEPGEVISESDNDDNDEEIKDGKAEDDGEGEGEGESTKKLFSLKAMNCPLHCEIFSKMRIYSRDLPLRMAEFGVLHRNELSGALHGLTRVRRFQQDDAHIFCRLDQIEDEVYNNLKMIEQVYSIFGLNFVCELSTRPDKYVGTVEVWDDAEARLQDAIARYTGKSKSKIKVKEGDGAFYGPKIDISLLDSAKRKVQCGTIQLDFNLPSEERFNLKYIDEAEEGKTERPVIVHRAVLGSLERFIGIILEHTQGKLPLGVTPYPISIVTVLPEQRQAAETLANHIHTNLARYGITIQIDTDYSADDIRQKIKRKERLKYALILTIGAREASNIEAVDDRSNAKVAVRQNKRVSEVFVSEIIDQIVNAYNL